MESAVTALHYAFEWLNENHLRYDARFILQALFGRKDLEYDGIAAVGYAIEWLTKDERYLRSDVMLLQRNLFWSR